MRLKERDLTILQKEKPLYRVKDKDGKVYKIPLFVSPGLTVLIDEKYAQNKEDEFKRGQQAILKIFQREYPELTIEWIEDNIDLTLYNQIISDIVVLSSTCIENIKEMREVKKNTKMKRKSFMKSLEKTLKGIMKGMKASTP